MQKVCGNLKIFAMTPICELLTLVPLREGFGIGFRWVVGMVFFLWKMREKGKRGGEGGGRGGDGKGSGKSMRTRLSKLPFSELPFSFSPISGASKVGVWVGDKK